MRDLVNCGIENKIVFNLRPTQRAYKDYTKCFNSVIEFVQHLALFWSANKTDAL